MRRVARFVESHHFDAGFMSTPTLADATAVSLAAAVRFPRVLEYKDFDALHDAAQSQVNLDPTSVEGLKSLPQRDTSICGVLQQVAKNTAQSNGIYMDGGKRTSSHDWRGSLLRGEDTYHPGNDAAEQRQ